MPHPFMHKSMYLTAALGLALLGCGGGSDAPSGVVAGEPALATDIRVERGPVLHAAVRDASGEYAMPLGNGVYRFSRTPVYPIDTLGGYIDANRNGVIDAGDVRMGSLVMSAGSGASAVTLASTLAGNPELKARLLALGFSEAQLLTGTPGSDRMLAALSDEVYRYAVGQGLSDVGTLTVAQFDALAPAIQARVAAYQASTASVAALEQQLVAELADKVDVLDAGEATGLGARSDPERQVIGLPAAALDDTQKAMLVYMWNEEKLAKDVYLALNALNPQQTLHTIATHSEAQHQSAMAALLEKYNLNLLAPLDSTLGYSQAALDAVPAGQYTLDSLQSLYNTLYSVGSASARSSLEVGCMVEVTDINDLDRDLALVSAVPDVRTVFENLRAGSYNHYWAFDQALRSLGVATGCCSLGDAYCHPEYPSGRGR